jgi:hypothetical protein
MPSTTASKYDGIIGAGFPRTSTTSLHAAINQLGLGPCHHMKEVFGNKPWRQMQLFELWGKIGDSKDKMERQALLREALKGYNSFVDFPSSVFWEDLVEMFPTS